MVGNRKFDFSGQVCPKITFPIQNRTNQHYHLTNLAYSKYCRHQVFFEPDLVKKGISGTKEISKHYHRIQHILINLNTKLHLEKMVFLVQSNTNDYHH